MLAATVPVTQPAPALPSWGLLLLRQLLQLGDPLAHLQARLEGDDGTRRDVQLLAGPRVAARPPAPHLYLEAPELPQADLALQQERVGDAVEELVEQVAHLRLAEPRLVRE